MNNKDFYLTLPEDLYRIHVNELFEGTDEFIAETHVRFDCMSKRLEKCINDVEFFSSKIDFYNLENFVNDFRTHQLDFCELQDQFSSLEKSFQDLENKVKNLNSVLVSICSLLIKGYEVKMHGKAKTKND